MLSIAELRTAKLFLTHAHASVLWTATLFHLDGNTGAASRLNSVAARLADEMRDIEALIAKAGKP